MKRIATMLAISAAAMAFAGGPAYAQVVQTPSEVPEAGFDDVLPAVPLTGPVGGTIASEAGGALQIGGDSGTGLVITPDTDTENFQVDD